jgi:hypothetical protein
MDFLAGAWGQPGVQDYARTLISQQASSWGAPGDVLAPFLQLVQPSSAPAPLANPALDPGKQTSTGVANVAKQDGQAAPGFFAQNGRMIAIVGGIVAAVVIVFTLLRKR